MQNEKIDLIQCENNSSYDADLHVQLFPPRGGGNSGLVLVACSLCVPGPGGWSSG